MTKQERDRLYYAQNPEKFREKAKALRHKDPRPQMIQNARRRAREQGVPCTITKDDILIPETCPLLGITLDHTKDGRHDGSPSLDKIVPALGYVPGNIRVISWLANAVKRDLTPEQLLTFARNIGPYLS